MAAYTKLPTGRWRVQIRRRGIYRAGTFDTKGEAQRWATAIESQISSSVAGKITPPKAATVADLIAAYQEKVPQKGRTQRATLKRLSHALGDLPLGVFGPVHLRDYIDGRACGGVTISQDLSYLATVFDWARHVRQLDVSGDFIRDARRALKYQGIRTRSNERDRIPTAAELEKLKAYWLGNLRMQIPMGLIVDFALASAMRLGEITRITAEDLDREERTVIIRDRKDPKVKAGNDQRVPLLKEAWAIVDHLGARAGRLFPYNTESVSTAFTRAVQACGIEDLHFHDLRHAATVNLFRMGLDIPLVSIITGHKSWQNLKRYTQLTAEDVHERVGRA